MLYTPLASFHFANGAYSQTLSSNSMKDRYKLNLFCSGEENTTPFLNVQEITDDVYSSTKLCILTLAVDFPFGTSSKQRNRLKEEWQNLLPRLDLVKELSIRHRVDQAFFEAICKMKNLEQLHFWTSTVENISSISNLQNLQRLDLDSFSRLTDISPIQALKNLQLLSIENSFKVVNYELIGQMTQLKGLRLCGDTFAPKNLRIKSLKPFSNLKNLKHLDLSTLSVIDNSFEIILALENLERFDISVIIPKHLRELIKTNHKKLIAGFFMDWDYDNKKIYENKEW
jgi:Leucine-rich repeat (LRR) protein